MAPTFSIARSLVAATASARRAPRVAQVATVNMAAPRWSRGLATRADDNDPTPGKARTGGSEQTMADSGANEDEIANSEGAYDADKTRPDESADKIEQEKDMDMHASPASDAPSENATMRQQKNVRTSGQPDGQAASGGTAASRKGR